jgi:Lrp/AsnC family transcriptional regulator, leucine-responsive regulatory protein
VIYSVKIKSHQQFFWRIVSLARRTTDSDLDDTAWRLLNAIQRDGRASLKALAKDTKLSIAATAERLKRLMESRIVRGIFADIDPIKAGYAVRAIIGITAEQPGKRPLLDRLRLAPEVLECHHVAGADSYIMTVVTRDLSDLERFVGTINMYGETRTSIVYSTPIPRRGLAKPGATRRTM